MRRPLILIATCAAALTAAAPALAATSPVPAGSPPEVAADPGGWVAGNADLANTRQARDSTITAANVAGLTPAWSVPMKFGSGSSNPIVSDGVVYHADQLTNITAIDARTGAIRWRNPINSPGLGQNGVTLADGRIIVGHGPTVVSLDATTGRQVWSTRLGATRTGAVDMAPLAWRDLIIVSTAPFSFSSGIYQPGQRGIVYGLNATTGRKLWSFDTTAEPKRHRTPSPSPSFTGRDVLARLAGTATSDLWGNPKINSGGGLWSTPSIDAQGTVYMDVANPAPFPGTPKYPNGSSRPGRNLYTDSLVAMNARTGKLKWYFQAIPHDIRDYDLQLPPILATFTIAGRPRDVVVAGGKMGTVYVVDRATGRLLWKRNVGRHNRWGNPSRPFPTKASQFPVTMYPGDLGGIETPMAEADGVIYVPTVDLCTHITAQKPYPIGVQICDPTKGTGVVDALDGATGRRLWTRALPTSPFAAATVAGDVVLVPAFSGKVYALRRSDGSIVSTFDAGAGVNAPPAVSGDTVYLGGAGNAPALTAWRLPVTK